MAQIGESSLEDRQLDAITGVISEIAQGHLAARASAKSDSAAINRLAQAVNELAENFANGRVECPAVTAAPSRSPGCAVYVAGAARSCEQVTAQAVEAQRLEAVGRLAGGIAHDFNNRLGVILSYVEFVLDGTLEDFKHRGDLLQIKRSAEGAAALTQQLLAYGRKQVLRPERLSLNDIANSVLKLIQRVIGEDIRLVANLAEDLAKVEIDRAQLELVLLNLASNARDAMPDGGILRIESANARPPRSLVEPAAAEQDRFVVLAVEDNGRGMSDEIRSKIFEPFFTTKPMGQGTGLGLSTAYGIVRQSGGTIEVQSQPGKGSCFRIYLPAVAAVAVTASAPVELPESQLVGNETILAVEDEEDMRITIRRVLSGAGYNVLVAEDGAEALRLGRAYAGAIHLLFTDVIMPGINGRMLAMQMALTRPAIKVLYTSGYADDVIARQGVLEAGANYIAKPFDPLALKRRIRQVLDGKASLGGR